MPKPKSFSNPFYALLLVVGVLFAVTACAYCVMAFRAVHPVPGQAASMSGLHLMSYLDQYGLWIMLVEIILLSVATAGAIATDDFWMKRARRNQVESNRQTHV